MMVSVVMSRTTRVPAINFSLSTLLRQPTTSRGPLLALTITLRQVSVASIQLGKNQEKVYGMGANASCR
jgi:hypothetical protein